MAHPIFNEVEKKAHELLKELELKEKALLIEYKEHMNEPDYDFPLEDLTELREEMGMLIYDLCHFDFDDDGYIWIQDVWGWDHEDGQPHFDDNDVIQQIKNKNFNFWEIEEDGLN